MPKQECNDKEQVYDLLVGKAQRHFSDSALAKLVKPSPYDPSRETHNFDNVVFEARPNRLTPSVIKGLACAVAGINPISLNKKIAQPFTGHIDNAMDSLCKGRLAVITGHQTMFEPCFALFGLQVALDKQGYSDYPDIAKDTHLVAARALATVDIAGRWPLTSLARQIANIYYTFPKTDSYKDIPENIGNSHNRRMLAQLVSKTRPDGSIMVISSSATTEKKNSADYNVVPRVTDGTLKLLQKNWDVWPIGGSFKSGSLEIRPGSIIPASDVSEDVIHSAMQDVVVASRNDLGIPSIYAQA